MIEDAPTSDIRALCKESDAVLFGSDELAYPHVKALRDKKLINLKEKKVYSVDNSYLSQVNSFRIKSFSHRGKTLSYTIAKRILSTIKGQPKVSIVLPYQLF